MWSSTSSEWKIPPVHLKCCWTCGITTAQDKLPLVCVAVLSMLMWPHHDTGLKFCIIYQKSIPVESTNRLSSMEHQLTGNPLQVLLPRQSRKAELLFQKKNSSPDRRFCSARPQTCMFKNSKMLLSHVSQFPLHLESSSTHTPPLPVELCCVGKAESNG